MKLKNEKGIALVLVLGALLIITTIAVEFAYNAHVSYDLAASGRDQLKAYYLARSAAQLSRLELKVERQFRAQYAGLIDQLKGSGIGTGISADPLCKQIPLSTGLLKGFASGALTGPAKETGEKAVKGDREAVEGADKFLTFGGDFEALCDVEERKFNLNSFRADLPPGQQSAQGAAIPVTSPSTVSLFDEQKQLLMSLLSQKKFESAFGNRGNRPDELRKVVNAIADWVDRNDRVDEGPGITGGSEDAEYQGPDTHYKVKNGKFSTLSEILLVAGVTDDLYQRLGPEVTVYGDNKLSVCQASDEMVRAFVSKYALISNLTPVNLEDEKRWNNIVFAVRLACQTPTPKPADIANAITASLGVAPSPLLAKNITTTNRFFRVEATGSVAASKVKIVSVIDTGQPNPNLWKTVYFRIE